MRKEIFKADENNNGRRCNKADKLKLTFLMNTYSFSIMQYTIS